MAIPTTWYVRTTGNDLNSGGTNADAAVIARDAGTSGVVTGTNLFDAGGGFNALAGTEAINLQDAGNTLVRGFTVVDDNNITLDAAPTSGNGSYNYRIGGARASVKKTSTTGTGNNAKWASGHKVGVKGGTYVENNLQANPSGVGFSTDGVEVVIDGTGGPAGSDGAAVSTSWKYSNFAFVNMVDMGLACSQPVILHKVRIQNCGGVGINLPFPATALLQNCALIGNTGVGISVANSAALAAYDSRITGGGTTGVSLGSGSNPIVRCIISNNAGIGVTTTAGQVNSPFIGNTVYGNTSDGLRLGGTNHVPAGGVIVNNAFVANGGYGVNSTAGAQVEEATINADFNLYYGNTSGARNNFPSGANDLSSDPLLVNPGSNDFTPGSGSPLIGAGYSGHGGNNKVNIGAVVHAAAAAGGGLLVGQGMAGGMRS